MIQNMFLGFAGIVTAVAAWSIWGGDMFPQAEDPKGEPETWSEDDMRRWLNAVCLRLKRASCSLELTPLSETLWQAVRPHEKSCSPA